MSKLKYYVTRTLISIGMILALTVVLFIFFRSLPGDYATQLAQSGASPEEVAQIREKWGLDDPLHIQYLRWLANGLTGDFGNSRVYSVPVLELTIPYMINSAILAVPAILAGYAVGSVYGAVLGNTFGTKIEKIGIIPPMFLGSIPSFFLGIVLLFLFAGGLSNIFPTQGILSRDVALQIEGQGPFAMYFTMDFWWHYVLPFATVMLKQIYFPATLMRSSVIEAANEDFDYYHDITGLSEFVRYKQRIKHASLPVLTVLPLALSRAISGLVLIEVVFNWPGIGSLLVSSVISRDVPVLQFVFLLVATWIILGNYIVDILYGVIDPRISVGGEQV